MFNALRSYINAHSPNVTKNPRNTLNVSGSVELQPATSTEIQEVVQTLEYKQVCNVVLITELDDHGQENPIAVAFINQNATGVVLSLHELSELE